MQRVLVQTKTAKNDLIKNYQIPAFKIFVIPNWLPANVTKQPKTDRDIDILYFGRFERQKRLEILIEVIEKLAAQNASLSAYLVGDGSENQMLQELVNKKNLDSIISILPPTAKIQEYLYRSKFFVLTSDFEGQPISLLEAMSAGVIPVTLEFPGVHEYIQVGENGFVEASPSKLRARLKKLLSDTSRCRELSRTIAREVKLKYGDETREKFLEALF
jgi:glycosyltransferase involved in cell wall biosynthesis